MSKDPIYEELVVQICRQKNYEVYLGKTLRPGREDLWDVRVVQDNKQIAFGCSVDRDATFGQVYARMGGAPIRTETKIV